MSESKVSLTIDGGQIEVSPGTSLLEAARSVGIEIPTLCWLPQRTPNASCFVCAVEVEGMPRLVPSCATPAQAGMSVRTHSDKVNRHRKTALELLLSDHLGDCVAPCQSVCPAHLDIPAMNTAVAEGRLEDAVAIAKDTIPLPATLGRICPTPCEQRCRRKPFDGPLSVCKLKQFVGDSDIAAKRHYTPPVAASTGKKVGIIGAGPAGLSAAFFLLRRGHACTIYDEHELAGGALRYAVPEERLPCEVLDAEIETIRRMGAEFRLGQRVSLRDVQLESDAVLLAIGPVGKDESVADLERSDRGLKVKKGRGETSSPGVFAAGAAVAPGKISVRSIGDAHAVADVIHEFLTGEKPAVKVGFSMETDRSSSEFAQARLALARDEARIEIHDGFTLDQAQREAERCLQCGCAKQDTCVLRDLATQYEITPMIVKGVPRAPRIDLSHPDVVFEENKCTACGICIQVAREQGEHLGLCFEGRGFDMRVRVPFGENLVAGLKTAAKACAIACPTGALYLRTPDKVNPQQ